MDKNQAILNFILTYEGFETSPIFMNFINAKDNDVQFLTSSNNKSLNKKFVDGSELKRYTFSLVITKSITNMAIAKELPLPGTTGETIAVSSENIDDLAEIQAFMDWVNEQGDNENYPDFGSSCNVEEMHTTAENPSLDGINTEVTPALALYSMEIGIDYIDYSKVIWS